MTNSSDLSPYCQYSSAHLMAGIPAVTWVPTPIGDISCCQGCADFYDFMTGNRP